MIIQDLRYSLNDSLTDFIHLFFFFPNRREAVAYNHSAFMWFGFSCLIARPEHVFNFPPTFLASQILPARWKAQWSQVHKNIHAMLWKDQGEPIWWSCVHVRGRAGLAAGTWAFRALLSLGGQCGCFAAKEKEKMPVQSGLVRLTLLCCSFTWSMMG